MRASVSIPWVLTLKSKFNSLEAEQFSRYTVGGSMSFEEPPTMAQKNFLQHKLESLAFQSLSSPKAPGVILWTDY